MCVCSIVDKVKLTFSDDVLRAILHMTRLVTLSSRIGHGSCVSNNTRHEGKYSLQADEFMTSINQARTTEHAQSSGCCMWGGAGDGEECGVRWRAVEDVEAWVHTPLGLCPDQQVSLHMLSVTPHEELHMEG